MDHTSQRESKKRVSSSHRGEGAGLCAGSCGHLRGITKNKLLSRGCRRERARAGKKRSQLGGGVEESQNSLWYRKHEKSRKEEEIMPLDAFNEEQ